MNDLNMKELMDMKKCILRGSPQEIVWHRAMKTAVEREKKKMTDDAMKQYERVAGQDEDAIRMGILKTGAGSEDMQEERKVPFKQESLAIIEDVRYLPSTDDWHMMMIKEEGQEVSSLQPTDSKGDTCGGKR